MKLFPWKHRMIVIIGHKYFTVEKTVEKILVLIKDNSQDWLQTEAAIGKLMERQRPKNNKSA